MAKIKSPPKKTAKKPKVTNTPTKAASPKVPSNPPKLPSGPVDLFKDAVCIDLYFRKPGNSRKLDSEEFKIVVAGNRGKSMDEKMVKAQKDLWDSIEFDKVAAFDGKVGLYMRSLCMPLTNLRKGSYLVSNEALTPVIKQLEVFKGERQTLVEEFLTVYPQKVQEAKERLKEAFDPTNYLTVSAVRRKFEMAWSVTEFGVPVSLKSFGADIYDEESKKFQESMKELHKEISHNLRLAVLQAVQRLTSVLAPSTDGKKHKIHDSNLENIMTILENFSKQNIVKDEDCAKIVEEAKKLVQGRSAESMSQDLRDNFEYRGKIFKEFDKIGKKLEDMVEISEERYIDFS